MKAEEIELTEEEKAFIQAVRMGNIDKVKGILNDKNPPDTDLIESKGNKDTPLHIAATHGYTEIVRILIEHGADLNAKDWFRSTPLHLAAAQNHTAVAVELIKRGADTKAKDFKGRTPAECDPRFKKYEHKRVLPFKVPPFKSLTECA